MRYFCITYYKRPNGTTDEQGEIVKSIKTRHLQTAAVILDFKNLSVIKASVNGVNVEHNWQLLIETYGEFYKDAFANLLALHHPEQVTEELTGNITLA